MEFLLTFTAYELALNSTVQEKWFDEVRPVMEENDVSLTYDGIQNLDYLERVVSGFLI